MPRARSYRLLCPIARALDRLGDRWSLLILRDLHAGPARFGTLQRGLTGIATNLLTSRLNELQDAGLVEHRKNEDEVQVYALTEAGERTAPVLFELARFGAGYPAPPELRAPGNLRLIVVTLKEALRRVADGTQLKAQLTIDGEAIAIRLDGDAVEVAYAPLPSAPLAVRTSYEALVAVSEGEMPRKEFEARHLSIERGSKRDAGKLLALLGRAFAA